MGQRKTVNMRHTFCTEFDVPSVVPAAVLADVAAVPLPALGPGGVVWEGG